MCGNSIEENIDKLNKKIKELDPSTVDFSIQKRLFFSPTNKYFNKIKQEENFIAILIEELEKEKNILNRDNITLEIEINRLRDLIEQINNEYANGEEIRKDVNSIIEKAKQENNNKKEQFYTQNVLTPLERKLYDIKQMALIKEQSALAFEIIRRNNKEIIRNLERIKNVTIEALNTAVIVAKSLYNQKLVLNKIKMMEKGTSNLIEGTANAIKNQSEEIAKSSNPEELLKKAFDNALNTLSNVNEENKKSIPENETKIIELKKIGEKFEI